MKKYLNQFIFQAVKDCFGYFKTQKELSKFQNMIQND
jgi:hypothetical protein